VSEPIAVVVPTFRPQAESLLGLLADIAAPDLAVVLSDDASPATYDRLLRAVADSGTPVIRHRRNAGIARGLNDGLNVALSQGFTWLLTLDQDTRISRKVISKLVDARQASDRVGVVGVEIIGDTNGDVSYPTKGKGAVVTTEEVFQTASLWRVSALTEIGGFDERLGIDGVDAAACLRLREHGYLVTLARGTRVEHRYGSATHLRLLGRTIVSTGHSPIRRESMVRNRLRLAPAEFRQSPQHALRTLRRVAVNTLLGVTLEQDRRANLMGSLRGIYGLIHFRKRSG